METIAHLVKYIGWFEIFKSVLGLILLLMSSFVILDSGIAGRSDYSILETIISFILTFAIKKRTEEIKIQKEKL